MADKEEVDPPRSDPAAADGSAKADDSSQAGAEETFELDSYPVESDAETDIDAPEDELVEPVADDEAADDEATADGELVSVGAYSSEAAAAGTSKKSDSGLARSKKDKATPRQKQTAEQQRRTGPVKFVKESVGELRKVVYPTGQQLINYFVVVLIFVLFIIGIVSLLDLGFGWVIFKIFS